ncbi:MAG: tetratricopeptide repeat protein [Verrucomicrobia bacterium]|nr:tetratricopeptide repeat protein [Verrucomicrobiota bacterium]
MSAGQGKHRTGKGAGGESTVRKGWMWVGMVLLLILASIWFGSRRGYDLARLFTGGSEPDTDWLIEPEQQAFAGYSGSASCRECHEKEYELWQRGNHGMAERLPTAALDRSAFDPPHRFEHGTSRSEARSSATGYEVLTDGYDGERKAYRVERVIGHDPLRQFLVAGPGGRLQTLEASYDPRTNEWFNVYGDEDRRPGEWGHWTGRGMNWNCMCAACHNTRLRKNYDEAADAYQTTMAELTVGCEACHGPMKAHAEWRRKYPESREPDPTVSKLNAQQTVYTCAGCHSRRLELTGDFKPGDSYFDHYALTTVDESPIYYADGQVLGENYVFASFLSSRMYHANVRCLDCHDPHSLRTILPGNDLCMRCHNGGYANSPIIDPAGHGRHKLDDTGGQCVGCHMPQTTYMERHPRRDHSFTIPDPLLTRELGIPNACNRCHADKDVEWSIQAVEQWYGDRMERPSRQRARGVAAARRGETAGRDGMLGLLAGDEVPYWKAVAAGLLDPWIAEPPVREALLEALNDPDPLVRAAAVSSLEPLAALPEGRVTEALRRRLDDPMRSVRFRAAWALRATLELESLAGREMRYVLDFNADQPGGQAQKGAFALARNQPLTALEHYRKAVRWDPFSAGLHNELAVVLSMLGRPAEALEAMREAVRLEPGEAEFQYRLALAWNETGRLDRALEGLEKTVQLDPGHARAWYNLGLARNQAGDTAGALDALMRGERADVRDAQIPYARATILLQQRRIPEGRQALEETLRRQPGFTAASELLEQLGR